jgi:hypothetical protein
LAAQKGEKESSISSSFLRILPAGDFCLFLGPICPIIDQAFIHIKRKFILPFGSVIWPGFCWRRASVTGYESVVRSRFSSRGIAQIVTKLNRNILFSLKLRSGFIGEDVKSEPPSVWPRPLFFFFFFTLFGHSRGCSGKPIKYEYIYKRLSININYKLRIKMSSFNNMATLLCGTRTES